MTPGLPFGEVWLCDFEFGSKEGNPPAPACMVAKEWRSGRLIRMWQDELYRAPRPPFGVGPSTLFVAFHAFAECSCFLSLGWPLPERIYDTAVEWKAQTNGLAAVKHGNLLDALRHYGIPGIAYDEKRAGQQLGMQGSWTAAERETLLDYCETDTVALGPLLDRQLLTTLASPRGLGQALLRGRFEATAAQIERNGIPVDVETLARIRAHKEEISYG